MEKERPSADNLSGAFAAALIAAAFLQAVEGALPRIPVFPWLKLGLSYAVVLPFFHRYGSLPAAMLLVGRNFLGWLIAGQAFSTFLIGTLASAGAFLVLGPWIRLGLRAGLLGYVGAGVALAAGQNLAQLVAVEALFIRHSGFYFQIPAMLLWSAVSGAAVAVLARQAAPRLLASWRRAAPDLEPAPEPENRSPSRLFLFVHIAWLILVLALPFLLWQAAFFALSCLLALLSGSEMKGRRNPFRLLLLAWPLILFQAWLHLWAGEGTFLWANVGITREGLEAFAMHALQLLNVILAGPRLARHFPRSALARSASPYVRGFALAWDRLPRLLAGWPDHVRALRRAWREKNIAPLLERVE